MTYIYIHIYTGYYIHAYRVSEINMPCHIVHHATHIDIVPRQRLPLSDLLRLVKEQRQILWFLPWGFN
jgi:hypothetical protein